MNDILEIINKNNINGFHLKGGTDKADTHSYDVFYSTLFSELRNTNGTLLEIGTYNGGSSLLWHEYFKNFKIVMTDVQNNIAENVLLKLEKERHEIIIHDAYKKNNVKKLKEKYLEGFDIIIEDGAHTLETQIFTIKEYFKILKKGGILIIEDIQSYDDAQVLLNINLRCKSKEIIDLRKNKNRYDDLLIVIKK
jgi:hypothetical protein